MIRHATVCLLNLQRRRHGRRAVRVSHPLTAVAGDYASQLVDFHFFEHVSPAGSTPMQRERAGGYRPATAAENLGYATGGLATPRRIVKMWMASPPHRRNILDPRLRDIGVGVVHGTPAQSGHGATYVTDYGRR